jgi:tetratricopeptide (TPR) repeat protein
MKRFDRLELDARHEQAQAQHASQAESVRDEHHWLRLASDERRNGNHESALRYYSRALEVERSLVEGWCGQVQMLIALGEHAEADLWSRKALELFKNNAALLAARTQALCRLRDFKGAHASCDAAIAQPGLLAAPWLARGELMLARGEPIEGYCFDKATQLDGDWLLLIEIADVYLHYARPTKAIVRLREAVDRAPGHAHCWFRLGTCELSLGLTDPASRSFARCLQVEPRHRGALDEIHKLTQARRPMRQWVRRMFRRG